MGTRSRCGTVPSLYRCSRNCCAAPCPDHVTATRTGELSLGERMHTVDEHVPHPHRQPVRLVNAGRFTEGLRVELQEDAARGGALIHRRVDRGEGPLTPVGRHPVRGDGRRPLNGLAECKRVSSMRRVASVWMRMPNMHAPAAARQAFGKVEGVGTDATSWRGITSSKQVPVYLRTVETHMGPPC